MPSARTAHAGHVALRLDNGSAADVSLLSAPVNGGTAYADVIAETDGALHFAKKHLGQPKYDDLVLTVGQIVSVGLFGWVGASWGPDPLPQDGAVVLLDHQFAIKSETTFAASLISETTFPALDAAAPGTGDVVIRVVPTFVETAGGSGALALTTPQKLWRTGRFRLEIAGLDCITVSRIESFTVRRRIEVITTAPDTVHLVPGRVEFPNLTVSLAASHAGTWHQWHDDFVIAGNNGDDVELEGTLLLLSSDLQTELSRIELHHLGIVRLTPAENPLRVTAELYCEEMVLALPGGAP